MHAPLFPVIKVNIAGPQGNAWALMAIISKVLEAANYSKEDIDKVMEDMRSSDYDHVLEVAKKYVTVIDDLDQVKVR